MALRKDDTHKSRSVSKTSTGSKSSCDKYSPSPFRLKDHGYALAVSGAPQACPCSTHSTHARAHQVQARAAKHQVNKGPAQHNTNTTCTITRTTLGARQLKVTKNKTTRSMFAVDLEFLLFCKTTCPCWTLSSTTTFSASTFRSTWP